MSNLVLHIDFYGAIETLTPKKLSDRQIKIAEVYT